MAWELKVGCPKCGHEAKYYEEEEDVVYFLCTNYKCKALLTLPFEKELDLDEEEDFFIDFE